jgi:hypothetical protein
MAAPEHVPTKPTTLVRSYGSPPRRPTPWVADRPGEIRGRQPEGEQLGTPGPDQGYALALARRFAGGLHLTAGESEADALAAAAAIAMKRSGLFGRAPIVHDVRIGLTVWGLLDAAADPELVELRRGWFEEVHHVHHYTELRRTHTDVAALHAADWRACLDLDAA